MKNKIEDLRNHLFAELERLGDESLSDEALEQEIQRAKAISKVAASINESAKLEIQYLEVTGQQPSNNFLQARNENDALPPKQ